MNSKERDELLIRLDERVKEIKEVLTPLPQQVEEHTSDIKWIKWVGSTLIGLSTTALGLIQWFK